MAIFNSYVKLPEGNNYHPGMTIRKKTKEKSWVHRFIFNLTEHHRITSKIKKTPRLQII